MVCSPCAPPSGPLCGGRKCAGPAGPKPWGACPFGLPWRHGTPHRGRRIRRRRAAGDRLPEHQPGHGERDRAGAAAVPGPARHARRASHRLSDRARHAGPREPGAAQGPPGHADRRRGFGFEAATADARIVAHVRRLAAESRRVASVCTGAGILAAAGLLDGRRATTHWRFADRLAQRHPAVEVDATPLYIRDGNVLTAAGVTSALDLALAIVEEDHGPEPARRIARELVIYLQRPGNQAQMSIFTTAPPVGNDVVRRIATHIAGHLGGDLSAPALAALAGVSERHLTRLFREHLGATPGRYVRRVRTEAAAHLLAGGTLPLAAVAARCGFGTAETLRQAFVARYGISPSRYRAASTRT
ncbi:helix-turn-helix domain-containing protein [Streptomyces sp. HUAS MG47]